MTTGSALGGVLSIPIFILLNSSYISELLGSEGELISHSTYVRVAALFPLICIAYIAFCVKEKKT